MARSSFNRLGGLSGRLLIFTIAFVMLAEVLIYAPSIARYRVDYFQDRFADAHLAMLAVGMTPSHPVSAELEAKLLRHLDAYAAELAFSQEHEVLLGGREPPQPDMLLEIDEEDLLNHVRAAFGTLTRTGNRVLLVRGRSPLDPEVEVMIMLDEQPLRRKMFEYSSRILTLSFVISLITATLVFLTLRWLFVRPMRRLTHAMISFAQAPEDPTRQIQANSRNDEIGMAERQLAEMQSALRQALGQRARLAALGEAVTKINHDLRNLLSTAQLVSDGLSRVNDPQVQRVTKTLLRAIDRAVMLCSRVLEYARTGSVEARRGRVELRDLVADVALAMSHGEMINRVPPGLAAMGDRDQLYRILQNLTRNAAEAGATTVEFGAERRSRLIALTVSDNGPGLPPQTRERLFQPFVSTTKSAGSGLGLAISREIARAHDGDLTLVASDSGGTTFRLDVPAA